MGLKGVPSMISPELLKILAEMGHGDTIVLADAHFPGTSIGAKHNIPVIRADGNESIAKLLSAIFALIEVDTYCPQPCIVMDRTDDDKAKGVAVPCYQIYHTKVEQQLGKNEGNLYYAERHEFYEIAKKAYAIVMTGDVAVYGNIIVTKGVTHGMKM